MIGLMRRTGQMRAARNIVIAIGLFALTSLAHGQLHPRFDLHELRPGMLSREVILHSRAALDTILWGGADGASIVAFYGAYLNDTGEFRVAVEGPTVTQVTFISRQRDAKQNEKMWKAVVEKIRKMHGKPSEEYHNVYHIITWEGVGEQLVLTTSDKGRFYSIALSKPLQSSTPALDTRLPSMPEQKR